MSDDRSGQPLVRRVPGAAREGPPPKASARRPLPDALIARMRAAVEAAHAAQAARTQAQYYAEPITEPLPRLQEMLAAKGWEPRTSADDQAQPAERVPGERVAAPEAGSGSGSLWAAASTSLFLPSPRASWAAEYQGHQFGAWVGERAFNCKNWVPSNHEGSFSEIKDHGRLKTWI